ncbi:MAG TPA: DEAD/DEAH box helicase family protein [Bacteroidota bacterium]|nr:DEAD/DEAH box helicase family protein [Bacteroidota bacterium]
MAETYLQNIVRNYPEEDLPEKWKDFDLAKFSENKRLFDFQQEALRNAIKALFIYHNNFKENKASFFDLYKENGLRDNLSYTKRQDSKTIKYLEANDYPEDNGTISFEHFINRMSFWMATGSGKTIVIVKLIEVLGLLMKRGVLPKKDIMFLTYRDDLIDQFKKAVDEYNSFHPDFSISLKELKEYESEKSRGSLFSKNNIRVYYYRSDLITDKAKEKQLDYKNYNNRGNWYIILDEAHKGDREESKRQTFYNILSRNGFLFNFSATFTDVRDVVTCVYNYNLEKYVKNGYGKHIFLCNENIDAFKHGEDFTEREKEKIVLKTLILNTIIRKHYEEINAKNVYHKPLILTLVNSVNTEESDLELYFRVLANIAKKRIDEKLFNEVMTDLKSTIITNTHFMFESEKLEFNDEIINSISIKDLMKYIFNTETNGKIEVLKLPDNRNELIFKLTTTSVPFALIKIGDITEWIKNKLNDYEIIESFDNESYFKNINRDDSNINILMGSRSFYEGWDSNRPNIILYINIGTGIDAKKFVLQSIGRGVRIQPIKNKRRRLLPLLNANEITKDFFDKVKDYCKPLETLFVFGTNAKNLEEIIETLNAEKREIDLGYLFEVNPEIEEKHFNLLIPVYKEIRLEDKGEDYKIPQLIISKNDFDLAKNYFENLGDKILLMKFNISIKVLAKMKSAFDGEKNKYFQIDYNQNANSINDPELLIRKISRHISQTILEFDKFKTLETEIVHFKHITTNIEDIQKVKELEEAIISVKNFKDKENEITKAQEEFRSSGDLNKFTDQIEQITSTHHEKKDFNYDGSTINIQYLKNHYYIPTIIAENQKEDYLRHIIKVESERDFINDLVDYLNKENSYFSKFDWWMFSKIDETLDEVYIPYVNSEMAINSKFFPDFIFWLQKGNDYTILFIDPKGTEHKSAYTKIDGYTSIFLNKETEKYKVFHHDELNITVKLIYRNSSFSFEIPEKYQNFWFNEFDKLEDKLAYFSL